MPKHEGITCGGRCLVAKTCSTCGELKMSHEFKRDSRGPGFGYWQSQCKDCQYMSAMKARNRLNNGWDGVKRTYFQWMPDEIRKLRSMLYAGKSYSEIGQELNRTVASVNGAEKRYMVKGWRENVQQLQRTAS